MSHFPEASCFRTVLRMCCRVTVAPVVTGGRFGEAEASWSVHLDLERLCSFCRRLAPQGIRKSQGLLKQHPAATPPTWGGREHVSCFSLFTISRLLHKGQKRIPSMQGTNGIA